jgi:hypothetical protein
MAENIVPVVHNRPEGDFLSISNNFNLLDHNDDSRIPNYVYKNDEFEIEQEQEEEIKNENVFKEYESEKDIFDQGDDEEINQERSDNNLSRIIKTSASAINKEIMENVQKDAKKDVPRFAIGHRLSK